MLWKELTFTKMTSKLYPYHSSQLLKHARWPGVWRLTIDNAEKDQYVFVAWDVNTNMVDFDIQPVPARIEGGYEERFIGRFEAAVLLGEFEPITEEGNHDRPADQRRRSA